ncbi:MAG: tetratricopeptide repeat protein [Acidobacteria bacterium]|nr:tetratricopeptide repeat protein [Acidobacteriota bacterium]
MKRLALLLLAASMPAWSGPAEEKVAAGNDHYFNLEYDEALRDYYQALDLGGPSASVWNHIATTLLYAELNRLGKLETSAFRGDNDFLGWEKPEPDPKRIEAFRGALFEARRLAEATLAKKPKDREALLALSANYGLEANYQFMIDKSYFAALRNGNKARDYAEQVIKQDPGVVDAYLVPGVQEYVIGSLPWAVRTLVSVGGIHGDKERGVEWVTRVADRGRSLRNEARVLMTLVHRRESRPLEAARVLEGLIEDFPRNYVLRLELGSMYLDAGEKKQALEVFRTADRMVRNDENRYARMPERLRKALGRKIEELVEELSQTQARAQ